LSDHQIPEGRHSAPAEPEVRKRRGLSIVWLIPLVAVAIGAWLIVRTLAEQGPAITIRFESAAGLEAKKTKIKYKSVDAGQVQSIRISDDSAYVVVTAELNKDAEPYLKDEGS
jgi:paraquat-inducible protein B